MLHSAQHRPAFGFEYLHQQTVKHPCVFSPLCWVCPWIHVGELWQTQISSMWNVHPLLIFEVLAVGSPHSDALGVQTGLWRFLVSFTHPGFSTEAQMRMTRQGEEDRKAWCLSWADMFAWWFWWLWIFKSSKQNYTAFSKLPRRHGILSSLY